MASKLHALCAFLFLWFSRGARGYILVEQAKNWADAETYCQEQHHSHLATIHDDAEATELMQMTHSMPQHTWIGLNDHAAEGVWVYSGADFDCYAISASNGCDATYKYWSDGEPNNRNDEDCGMIWNDAAGIESMLNDAPCGDLFYFICNEPVDCASFEYCSADLASDVAAVTADVAANSGDISTITNNVATNTADLAAINARIDAIVATLQDVQNASPVLDYHGVDGGDTNWWLVALLLVNINVIVIAVCIGVMCACGKVPKYQPVKAEAFDFEK